MGHKFEPRLIKGPERGKNMVSQVISVACLKTNAPCGVEEVLGQKLTVGSYSWPWKEGGHL